MTEKIPTIRDVVQAYNLIVRHIEDEAQADGVRAYGGVVRAAKGLLVEGIARNIIKISWRNLGGKLSRISFDKQQIVVPIKKAYVARIVDTAVREYVQKHIKNYTYKFKTDVHVSIDGKLAVGVECKAYAENAMIKRIAVDGTFLKLEHKNAHTALIQLESQLGGDYSDVMKEKHYGSFPTHTILSYFGDLDLHIITLLEGERKVDKPIHKKKFYKPLTKESVVRAVKIFETLLKDKI